MPGETRQDRARRLLLPDDDRPAEGRDRDDGAAVAVGAAEDGAPGAAAAGRVGRAVRGYREVGPDIAGERVCVDLEARVARDRQPHVAGLGLDVVPALLGKDTGEGDLAAHRMRADVLAVDVFET